MLVVKFVYKLNFTFFVIWRSRFSDLTVSSTCVESLFLADVPVPFTHLVTVDTDFVTNFDALLYVPLDWINFEFPNEILHLAAIFY
jgi:hypothetical protein